MASFMSTATSTQPARMCACGYVHCVVKISHSARNPGRAYYQCARGVPCVSWIGWCDEYGRQRAAENDTQMSLVLRVVSVTLNKLCVCLQ
ncbi:hypothetical protein CsSME_00048135 [Camellia sinensis var. sinensis]